MASARLSPCLLYTSLQEKPAKDGNQALLSNGISIKTYTLENGLLTLNLSGAVSYTHLDVYKRQDQEIVYNHPTAQAIVCNSGIANACTGEEGYGYCRKTAEAASAALSIPEDSVLFASTGVIGKQIPIDKIAAGVEMLKPQLAATREAAATAAQGDNQEYKTDFVVIP